MEGKALFVFQVVEAARLRLTELDCQAQVLIAATRAANQTVRRETFDSDDDDFNERLAFEGTLLTVIERQIGKFLLLGLHRVVELAVKQALRRKFHDEDAAAIAYLHFERRSGISFSVDDYELVDAMNKVDSNVAELIDRNGAVRAGCELSDCPIALYARLKDSVLPFIQDLAEIVIP